MSHHNSLPDHPGDIQKNEEQIDQQLQLAEQLSTTDPQRAIELFEGIIDRLKANRMVEKEAAAFLSLGSCLQKVARLPEAIERYKQAKTLYTILNDQAGIANAEHGAGNINHQIGNVAEAIACCFAALDIRQQIGDPKEVESYNLLGLIHAGFGNHDRALEVWSNCLAIHQESGNKHRMAATLTNMGNVYWKFQEDKKALNCHFRSMEINNEIGEHYGLLLNYVNIGNVYMQSSSWEDALHYKNEAINLCSELGDNYTKALTLASMGMMWTEQEEWKQASECFTPALSLAEEVGAVSLISDILLAIADSSLKEGKPDLVPDLLEQALDIINKTGYNSHAIEIYLTLARAYEELKDHEQAIHYYKLHRETLQERQYEQQAKEVSIMETRLALALLEVEREGYRQKSIELEQTLEEQSGRLTSIALQLASKNEFLAKLTQQLQQASSEATGTKGKKIEQLLASPEDSERRDENWQLFEKQFQHIHSNFTQRLAIRFPSLTQTEMKVCALIKTGLSSKEIAVLLTVSLETVKTHRRRIRKKLELDGGANLAAVIVAL